MELYRKVRPKSFKGVLGQQEAVAVLESWLARNQVPHVVMATGPSGTGKTTLLRILARKLGCTRENLCEMNCAKERGIDMIRDVGNYVNLAPMGGTCRVWIWDEIQKLSSDAVSAALKILEDPPDHAYFLLATTDPDKLPKTFRDRCSVVKTQPINATDLETLLMLTAQDEGASLPKPVLAALVEAADGSARHALQDLGRVIGLGSEKEQLAAIVKDGLKKQAIDLAKAIMFPSKDGWGKAAAILKDIEGEDPEGVRRLVLAYARTVMLGGGRGAKRGFQVICSFEANFYDSGAAGLARASWETLHEPE